MLVFTGPSGVGKTQLAEHLAAILHKDGGPVGECLKQIPMNQYQDEGSIATLIGPPVGVVGEGQLTGALMRCPTAVIILDEFEKAHPKAIPDVFLGAFDARAQLVDTKSGQTVPTNRATFILTSNFGAESILAEQAALLDLDPATRDLARQRVKQAVQQAMVTPGQGNPFARSEFRGRIRSVVIFTTFSQQQKHQVVKVALAEVQRYYREDPEKRYNLLFTDRDDLHGSDTRILDYFASFYGGADGREGMRPLISKIESECDTLLREAAVAKRLPPRGSALFRVVGGALKLTTDKSCSDEPASTAAVKTEPDPLSKPRDHAGGGATHQADRGIAGAGSAIVGMGSTDASVDDGGAIVAVELDVLTDREPATAMEFAFQKALAAERARAAELELKVR